MPRPVTMGSSSSPPLATAHSLLVLAEYAHTLDSLPLDLSRQFADLRELDAVLSASTVSVTQKIYELIDLVENSGASREARLAKLTDISEEAQRLKLGGEDKIRVASQAADNLALHKAHMSTLLTAIAPYDTSFTPAHLYLRTTYPHLPPRPIQDATPLEGGRRRRAAGRGQLGGMLAVEAPSPVKGRKRARDDEDSQPTPRRDRENNNTNTHRRGGTTTAKTRKVEPQPQTHVQPHPQHRAISPSAESVLSIVSHPVGLPPASSARPLLPVAQPPPQTAPRPAAAQQAPPPHQDGEPADNDDQDGGRYCYCQGPSYGEMVGCDGEHCAYEWFHLTCIGLTGAPKAGTWYCDDCKAKRAGNKKGRSGKRRTGGGSGGAADTSGKTGRGRT
ncbi:hypothetical protein JB92DRAFT_2999442 [Gautieria morchelliformis]|nr:hypothetical protein JB92DRAFT_2999442 [Gautieria morchelliformis]